MADHTAPGKYELPDLREKSTGPKGEAQILEKRLFIQLQVYTGCDRPESLAAELKESGLEALLYLDVNDPKGVGVLSMSEDPATFTGELRRVLTHGHFAGLQHRPKFTMIGRTYATGREPNL